MQEIVEQLGAAFKHRPVLGGLHGPAQSPSGKMSELFGALRLDLPSFDQRIAHRFDRQRPERDQLATRDNRRQQGFRLWRDQNHDDSRRRFLQGFEQGVRSFAP